MCYIPVVLCISKFSSLLGLQSLGIGSSFSVSCAQITRLRVWDNVYIIIGSGSEKRGLLERGSCQTCPEIPRISSRICGDSRNPPEIPQSVENKRESDNFTEDSREF